MVTQILDEGLHSPSRRQLFSTAPVYHDGEQLVGVLQQVQALMQLLSTQHSGDPSLEDVVSLLFALQLDFGRCASLETVIQTLVAQLMLDRESERRRVRKHIGMREAAPILVVAREVRS